jgi:hypothetical protein
MDPRAGFPQVSGGKMSTHTPEPWEFFVISEVNEEYRVTAARSLFLTLAPCADGYCPGETRANAKLIAAAPDLLAACIALVNWCEITDPNETRDGMEHLNDVVDQARDAIAKANGENQ